MLLHCAVFLLIILLGYGLLPLLRPIKKTLPVLLMEPPSLNTFSISRVEKLLQTLQRKHFTSVLPSDVRQGTLPERPVLMVFPGGYQIYMQLLPLLEKYDFRAAIALPAGLIGQYDAWKAQGPWQNLLTMLQINTLQDSQRIEFISQGLDNCPLDTLDTDTAVWQLSESKNRLQQLYHVPINTLLHPQQTLRRPLLLRTAAKIYPLQIGHQKGNNYLPLTQGVLQIFPVHANTCLFRLCCKMIR